MRTKHILRKQLSYLPCRFILGILGRSRRLTPEIGSPFLDAMKREFEIEDILPTQDFPNPPENYFREMGEQPLSTAVFILGEEGSYTDLHHLKRRSIKIEKKFRSPNGGERIFNINPGAVGTYGICLSSHKPTGGRRDLSTYAYGLHPHLFFGEESFYERIMEWDDGSLVPIGSAGEEGKFPEYFEESRVRKFERLVQTLPQNNLSVSLMAERA